MENTSGRRRLSRLATIIGLCLGTASATGFAQMASPPAPPSAISFDILSTPPVTQGVLPGLPGEPPGDGAGAAMTAAVADGITTGIGLSLGAVEMNPLVSPTPWGVLAMTGLKIGLIKYAETLPEREKRTALKSGAAIWSGAAVNNLLVLAAAPTPLSIVAGIIAGIATWLHMDGQYQEKDRLAALRAAPPVAVAGHGNDSVGSDSVGSDSVVTAGVTGGAAPGD